MARPTTWKLPDLPDSEVRAVWDDTDNIRWVRDATDLDLWWSRGPHGIQQHRRWYDLLRPGRVLRDATAGVMR